VAIAAPRTLGAPKLGQMAQMMALPGVNIASPVSGFRACIGLSINVPYCKDVLHFSIALSWTAPVLFPVGRPWAWPILFRKVVMGPGSITFPSASA
jgi:hypothetical protein